MKLDIRYSMSVNLGNSYTKKESLDLSLDRIFGLVWEWIWNIQPIAIPNNVYLVLDLGTFMGGTWS